MKNYCAFQHIGPLLVMGFMNYVLSCNCSGRIFICTRITTWVPPH